MRVQILPGVPYYCLDMEAFNQYLALQEAASFSELVLPLGISRESDNSTYGFSFMEV